MDFSRSVLAKYVLNRQAHPAVIIAASGQINKCLPIEWLIEELFRQKGYGFWVLRGDNLHSVYIGVRNDLLQGESAEEFIRKLSSGISKEEAMTYCHAISASGQFAAARVYPEYAGQFDYLGNILLEIVNEAARRGWIEHCGDPSEYPVAFRNSSGMAYFNISPEQIRQLHPDAEYLISQIELHEAQPDETKALQAQMEIFRFEPVSLTKAGQELAVQTVFSLVRQVHDAAAEMVLFSGGSSTVSYRLFISGWNRLYPLEELPQIVSFPQDLNYALYKQGGMGAESAFYFYFLPWMKRLFGDDVFGFLAKRKVFHLDDYTDTGHKHKMLACLLPKVFPNINFAFFSANPYLRDHPAAGEAIIATYDSELFSFFSSLALFYADENVSASGSPAALEVKLLKSSRRLDNGWLLSKECRDAAAAALDGLVATVEQTPAKIVDDASGQEERMVMARIPKKAEPVFSPTSLFLGPGQCSLRCAHCLQGKVLSNYIRGHREDFKRMLSSADQAGIVDYSWCIGEPFEDRDFLYDMLRQMVHLTNIESIGFVTNGRFAESYENAVTVLDFVRQILIEGHRDTGHVCRMRIDFSWDKQHRLRGVETRHIINLIAAISDVLGLRLAVLNTLRFPDDQSVLDLLKALRGCGLIGRDTTDEELSMADEVFLTNGMKLVIYKISAVLPEGSAAALNIDQEYLAPRAIKEEIIALGGADLIGHNLLLLGNGNWGVGRATLALGCDGSLYLSDKFVNRQTMPLAYMTDVQGAIDKVNRHPVLRALVSRGVAYCLDAYDSIPASRRQADIYRLAENCPDEHDIISAATCFEHPQVRAEMFRAVIFDEVLSGGRDFSLPADTFRRLLDGSLIVDIDGNGRIIVKITMAGQEEISLNSLYALRRNFNNLLWSEDGTSLVYFVRYSRVYAKILADFLGSHSSIEYEAWRQLKAMSMRYFLCANLREVPGFSVLRTFLAGFHHASPEFRRRFQGWVLLAGFNEAAIDEFTEDLRSAWAASEGWYAAEAAVSGITAPQTSAIRKLPGPSAESPRRLNVLILCNQNLERSPLAAALLTKHMPDDLLDRVEIHSGAIFDIIHDSTLDVYLQCDPVLREHRPVRYTEGQFRQADLVFVMTKKQKAEMSRRYPHARAKIRLLLGDKELFTSTGDYPSLVLHERAYRYLRKQIISNLSGIYQMIRQAQASTGNIPVESRQINGEEEDLAEVVDVYPCAAWKGKFEQTLTGVQNYSGHRLPLEIFATGIIKPIQGRLQMVGVIVPRAEATLRFSSGIAELDRDYALRLRNEIFPDPSLNIRLIYAANELRLSFEVQKAVNFVLPRNAIIMPLNQLVSPGALRAVFGGRQTESISDEEILQALRQ
ncbi:MAG: hypothetical protein PHS09_06820, partial [Candidatus Omnitrophica bacterium]|nr:hypothetical protein [Candidatus Omnitrophota bacterium]